MPRPKRYRFQNFNPRTPGGVRHVAITRTQQTTPISIHAPRVGCDTRRPSLLFPINIFQSTHPGWGATRFAPTDKARNIYFNPRTPGGVRPAPGKPKYREIRFQSTHPGWGATIIAAVIIVRVIDFNPRTPGGVRHAVALTAVTTIIFQSTHPGWGAT